MWEMQLLKKLKWFGFLFLLTLAEGAPAAETPLEVYGQLPSLENVAISPDGTRIAFIESKAGERIACFTADMKTWSSIKIGPDKLRALKWADNYHLLFVTSTTDVPMGMFGARYEWLMLLSYDITTGKSHNPVTPVRKSKEKIMNIITGMPMSRSIDGQTIVYVEGCYVTDHNLPALFRLNLTTNEFKVVKRGSEKNKGWLVDENGIVVAAETYDEKKKIWGLSIRKEGDLVEIASGDADIEHPTIEGLSQSGDEVWLSTSENGDPAWKSMSLDNGIIGEPLNEVKGYKSLRTDPYTNRIVGGYLNKGHSGFVFLDQQRQVVWEELQKYFKGHHVDLINASKNYKKIVILVDGPTYGYAYYLFDVDTHKLLRIGNVYEGLTQIAEVRSIEYTAADGMKIPGFLTLPFRREAKNLPLAVLPHGGPAVIDDGRFDWWAQALASQGYAVLQANYRGSDIDWKFMSAGFGEWGRKMQTDLSDGVRYLVKEGIVDSNRVSIVGASYGGYAALAGATLDAGVYRCAVSVSGISDLRKYLKWVKTKSGGEGDSVEYWDRFYGASGLDDPILETLSPLAHTEQVKIPIMLIHGLDDTVVPYDQSKVLADALKKAGKPFEFVTLNKEDHWLSRGETRLQMLEATVKFLRENNPPD